MKMTATIKKRSSKIDQAETGQISTLTKLVIRSLITGVFLLFFSLLSYLAFWAVHYREAASAPQLIDLRRSGEEGCKCVTLCASLADNELGFPGHAYVIWSPNARVNLENDFSLGYMPANYWDQFHSLYKNVQGAVLENVRGNTRNLDRLTLLVSNSDYEESLDYARKFPSANFKTGERDCVAFVNYMAQKFHLRTYDAGFIYPQDYIRILKSLNRY